MKDNMQSSECTGSSGKERKRFTWDMNQNPNRLSRFFMSRTNILDPDPNKKPFNYVLLGFLLPFAGLCICYLILGLIMELSPSQHPGFKQVFSTLNSDAYHQYFPFFKAFRRNILSGRSLIYSWDVGMGMDYIGLYAYYLGSPLNLLSLIIPEGWLLDYFTMLTPIRIGLAGMFFALFLKKIFDRNDFSIALFGTFYATCAWVFGYMWNTMWLDTFALLPLVVLGTVNLLTHRKYVLYTVSLFLSVMINYYIGFFTCIFTLLVFICYEICRWKSLRKFLADLGLMAVFTILALGATAIITLPTYTGLLATSAGNSIDLASLNAGSATGTTAATEPTKFVLNMTDGEAENGFRSFSTWVALLQAMTSVATNCFAFNTPNYIAAEGLPNIYCGIFAMIFTLLFITCKEVKWRDRICGIFMLLFLNASFVIENLNYIWHGFHATNMIPYRFSFLYSFVMLYMAYRAWLLRRKFRPWQVIAAMSVATLALFLSDNFKGFLELLRGPISLSLLMKPDLFFPFVNLMFLGIYCIALLCFTIRKPIPEEAGWEEKRTWYKKLHFRRSLGAFLLVFLICLELFVNFAFFAVTTPLTVDAANYPMGTTHTEKMVETMKKDEEPFYRAETSQYQILNDGALIGYNGITTFTSSANQRVTKFFRNFTFAAVENWNRYAYNACSPVADMFLGIKYQLYRSDYPYESPYYSQVNRSGNVSLLKNNYYLPLGFMVDPKLAQVELDSGSRHYNFQADFLSAALGRNVAPYQWVTAKVTSDKSVTVHNTSSANSVSCSFSTSSPGRVYYDYTIEQEGYMSVVYSFTRPTNTSDFNPKINIYIDRGDGFIKTPVVSHSFVLPCMQGICQVHPGDRVRIALDCGANWQNAKYNILASILDEAVVKDAYAQLSQSTLQVTKFEDTLIEGTIHCEKDGLLYTSIPKNDNNWHVFVDGKEAQITLIGDAMIGVMLKEGTHQITFRYENKVFRIGMIVSLVCVFVFICILLTTFLVKRHKRNYTAETAVDDSQPDTPPPLEADKENE